MTTFSGLFGGAAGAGQVNAPHLGYRSGAYYVVNATRPGASAATNSALTNGATYYSPFYVHSDITVSGIGFNNGSSAENGKKARVAIYTNDSGRPGALLIAASEITITAAAAIREATISQTLTKGWYWAAITTDGMNVSSVSATDLFNAGWSMSSLTPDGTAATKTSVTGTYAALPSTATPPTTSSVSPLFFIKVA